MLLGSLDVDVQNWVRQVRLQGGVINARVVMAGAEAIVTKHAKHKLECYGGHITITKHYARSLLRRMGFVKRKGTKNVKQLPSDFEEIKASFVEKVSNVVKQHDIPDALVINWDQTGVQMVPGGDWTMDERGSQQVPITGLDDKRQITLVLAIAKDGTLLTPQLIYAGKTERCLPKCDFPDLWDVTFTESHWSNEESMLRYVDKIIIPYVNSVRDGLPLVKSSQQAVAIFDVYRAHQSPSVLKKLKDNGITPLFVPACCTDRLQPLDVAVNYDYKEALKARFHEWYTQQVIDTLNSGDECTRTPVDLKTSTLKPIHAKWIVSAHAQMENRCDLVQTGFRKAGL
jgi:hypothetical protein